MQLHPLSEPCSSLAVRRLSVQVFDTDQFIVVNGAGGGVACGACLPVAGNEDIVIDQTLYWQLVPSEREAWYQVGLLNTDVLTDAIREFNPEGELGPRHLHTLPNRVIPQFDATNQDYLEIADLALALSALAKPIIADDDKISNPVKPIASRRRRLRSRLKQLPEFAALEDVCANVLGVNS